VNRIRQTKRSLQRVEPLTVNCLRHSLKNQGASGCPVREPIGTIAYEVTHMLGDAMRRFEIQICPARTPRVARFCVILARFSAGDGD
jgi:hypothetical protein